MADKVFKGVPVSSRSQAGEIPIEVVSQPSYVDMQKILDPDNNRLEPDEAAIKERLDAHYARENNKQSSEETFPERNNADFRTPEETESERAQQVSKAQQSPLDSEDFMHSSIIAIPKRMPTMLDVRAKDSNFRLRWVNFKADGGRRVDECKALGFTIARPEEVIGLEDGTKMVQTDGIKYHDVILMKVPTKLMFGWLKQNAIDSSSKVSPRRLHQAAKNEGQKIVRQGISSEGYNPKDLADMIQVYVPGDNEIPNR